MRDQEGFLGKVALEASETSCVGVRKLKVGGGKGRQKEQHRQRDEVSTAVKLERPTLSSESRCFQGMGV